MRGWLWGMIGVLLLAAALTTPKLNYDALSFDEVRAYIVAGGAHHGPLTFPQGVWRTVAAGSPDQALGFALIIWVWGALVGWSEVAARTLPYLAGMLTIALTYRIGADLFNRFAGFSAATILATSIYFITFMHKFRVFTLAALAVSAALWFYWRLAFTDRRVWFSAVGLVVSGIALFYTHYYMTPFVGVLGLYHLLFVRKTRRWWLPVGLFALVMVAFIPEFNVLQTGFDNNINNERVTSRAMSPVQITGVLAHYFSNGYAPLFWGTLLIALVAIGGQLRTRRLNPHHVRLVGWSVVVMFGMVLAVNAISQVFVISRVRYLMGVWAPLALLIGVGISGVYHWRRGAAVGLLALWAGVGIVVTLQDDLMWIGRGDQIIVHPWRELAAAVFADGEPDDALVFQGKWFPQFGHYTHGIPIRWDVRPYYTESEMRESLAANYKRVWYATNRETPQEVNLAIYQRLLHERGYHLCEVVMNHRQIGLALYGQSPAFCPSDATRYTFGSQFALAAVDVQEAGDTLTIMTGWRMAAGTPIDTYSAAFHLMERQTERVVAQADVGFGTADGPYTPLRVTLDLGDVPAGSYTLGTAVYAWRTGERLPGTDGERIPTVNLLPIAEIQHPPD